MFIYHQRTKSHCPGQAASCPANIPLSVHGSHPLSAVTSHSAPGTSPPLPAALCFSPVFPAMLSDTQRHSAASRPLLCACHRAVRMLTTHALLIRDSSRLLPAFREWFLLFWLSRYVRELGCFPCPSAVKFGYCIHGLQCHRTRCCHCPAHRQVPRQKIAVQN